MVTEYLTLCAAFRQIQGLEVIEGTGKYNQRLNWRLPAVIIDPEEPDLGAALEDGKLSVLVGRYTVMLHVEMDKRGENKDMEAIEELMNDTLTMLPMTYPNCPVRLDEPYFGPVSFNKDEALGWGFKLSIKYH